MTPRLKTLLSAATVMGSFALVWNLIVLPRLTPKVACVIEQSDGTLIKARGDDCRYTLRPAVLLRAK